ncbi:VOC family protein [Oceanicoccus sp. KOV_DT_Chl]|uniref:VOC family protein n=1 Tax=Oceanicoccus sp. KOV_DT_Chl TaxID=1904639 RepID=UPI001F16B0A5|nr:VOC family protein [Oceanicoccus sp. KOV_DT_Chl]
MTSAVNRPAPTAGMRHVALFVESFEETVMFYTKLLGMAIEWEPDPDNVYLTSGNDNLALHRYKGGERPPAVQRLDHIGFIIDDIDQVDVWHHFLQEHGVRIKNPPKTHRDGARSFYCLDPDGTVVQMIFHPPISKSR